MELKIESINFLDIEKQLESLDDPDTMQQVHNTYAKFLDPYVPMDEGVLAHDVTVTPEYVQYNSPYAHYMYTGIVYGPNIPIMSNGEIIGYWSPPNQAKHPTGASIDYSKEKHPLATHHWDKAAMDSQGDVFKSDVKKILQNKLKGG